MAVVGSVHVHLNLIERKEKTTPFSNNLTRSLVIYRAAQTWTSYLEALCAGGSLGQPGEELHDQLLRAAVQQPVCLIQHKELDSIGRQLARLYEVHHSPWNH